MTSKERVRRAIEFGKPDQIPVYGVDPTDIARVSYRDPTGWMPRNRRLGEFVDEWGTRWYTGDQTMGHVRTPAIKSLSDVGDYRLPDPHLPERWNHLASEIEAHRDRYVVGNAQYLCYDRLTFLLGQTDTLLGLADRSEELASFMDRVIEFEMAIVDELAERGVDGIRFWDDVGAVNGVIMGPVLWRDLFEPRYRQIFTYVRKKRLHVHWHSCGNCRDILDDLVGIGVQVFSIGEPFMMGLDELSARFCGHVCFECAPDNRSILAKADRGRIETAVDQLIRAFADPTGGLILVAAPDNFDCVPEDVKEFTTETVLSQRHTVENRG